MEFHFQGEMEADAIAEWLGKYSEDDVEEYFISQELPADWDAKELKALPADWDAKELKDAHVVVMFCVPPKPACREAAQKLGKIAEYFALLDPEERVVFGQLDLQKNQVPHNDVKEVFFFFFYFFFFFFFFFFFEQKKQVPHSNVKEAPTIWMWPRGKKEPPYPIDLTAELAEPRAMVSQIKKAAGITASKARLNEDAYVAAAKRFKAAVRALQGDVQPAVDALLLAAEHLEASQAGQ
ncbi:hypothetical protein T484DRAFT_1790901 [Baffinella frigidus]|nr:hypothetical protein T484DRAFT_1790901 [Cryptophyta sp. CCMP2293]